MGSCIFIQLDGRSHVIMKPYLGALIVVVVLSINLTSTKLLNVDDQLIQKEILRKFPKFEFYIYNDVGNIVKQHLSFRQIQELLLRNNPELGKLQIRKMLGQNGNKQKSFPSNKKSDNIEKKPLPLPVPIVRHKNISAINSVLNRVETIVNEANYKQESLNYQNESSTINETFPTSIEKIVPIIQPEYVTVKDESVQSTQNHSMDTTTQNELMAQKDQNETPVLSTQSDAILVSTPIETVEISTIADTNVVSSSNYDINDDADDIKDDIVTVKPNLIEAMVLSNLIGEILSSQTFNSNEENEDAIYQATRNNVKNRQKISPVDTQVDKNSVETSGNDSSMISNENEAKRIEDSNLVPTPNDTVGDEEEKDAITSQKTEPTTNAEESFLLTSYNVKKWQFSGGLAATDIDSDDMDIELENNYKNTNIDNVGTMQAWSWVE